MEKSEFESWQLSVCLFKFFPLPIVLAFVHDQTHTLTQTRKVLKHAERRKGDREQFASLDLWITDFMFDSGRSFRVKYDLIRRPY